MEKERAELMNFLRYQSVFTYCEGEEPIRGLQEIANYYFPEWFVKGSKVCMALTYAFTYGAICGVRHERKKRKEKVNRAKGGAF